MTPRDSNFHLHISNRYTLNCIHNFLHIHLDIHLLFVTRIYEARDFAFNDAEKQLIAVKNLACLNCQEPTCFHRRQPRCAESAAFELLILSTSEVTGGRPLCSPHCLYCSFFFPVHDISTIETAHARSLLSRSTSFRGRDSRNLLPTNSLSRRFRRSLSFRISPPSS